MKKNLLCGLVCLSLFPTLVFPQLKKDTKVDMATALTQPGKIQSIVGLIGLDPNKFTMSHSYSLSFTSVGGQTFNQGLYLNTMRYQLADPLSMYVQIGLQHQPFGNQLSNTPIKDQVFISEAGVEYKPSENFKLQLQYSQRPYYYSPYNSYHRSRLHRDALFETDAEDDN